MRWLRRPNCVHEWQYVYLHPSEELIADGWTQYLLRIPPSGVPIMLTRENWDEPIVMNIENIWPHANVSGLYWKLTGIAKEMQAVMSLTMSFHDTRMSLVSLFGQIMSYLRRSGVA